MKRLDCPSANASSKAGSIFALGWAALAMEKWAAFERRVAMNPPATARLSMRKLIRRCIQISILGKHLFCLL